jgi:hypothetical protein
VKEKQRSELLKQIDIVIAQNGGHPYSNEMFREAQVCVHISECKDSGNEYVEISLLILFYFCRKWSSRRKDIDSGGYSKEEIQILLEKMEKAHAEQHIHR